MQRITSLTLRFRNFLSFGNNWNEIKFENNTSTFINGINEDANTKNGVGKSAIKNILTYAIYNKAFDSITLPRLINTTNAAKNTLMEVEYSFMKGNEMYVIHRCRGESHGVTLTKDGVDITPDSINETDALIERIYGISYDLFTRVIVFDGSTPPFLDLPVSLQRAHIEELFNIAVLSEKAQKLKKVTQTTESDIKVEEALLKERERSYKSYLQRLADMEKKVINWETQKTLSIEQYKKSLQSIEGVNFEEEEVLHLQVARETGLVEKINASIASAARAKDRLVKELVTTKQKYDHLVHHNCPYCLQPMPNIEEKLNEEKKNMEAIDAQLSSTIKEHNQMIADKKYLDEQIMSLKSAIKYNDLSALIEIKTNAASIMSKLEQLEIQENPHLDTYEAMLTDEIEAPSYVRLDELKSLVEHQHFLQKLLTDKNSFLRRKIISKTIPFLNLQMNEYSKQLGLPHVVQFRDDMTCSVTQYGRELDFGNLSSGETKRVNLAMALAFRDVLHHLHARHNVLFVDEVDASLCKVGVEAVAKVISNKTKSDELSTFVIMHREGIADKFDNVMTVSKSGGFSNICWTQDVVL